MASSVTSICNRALQLLGADTIIDINDDNNRARAMLTAYEPIRDAELRRRRWKFAMARASLPALASAPIFGYTTKYQLPNDHLRIVQVGDYDLGPTMDDYIGAPADLYMIEGRELLTNLSAPLNIRYIRQVVDSSLFDSAFAESLAARIAQETCYRITQSNELKESLRKDYMLAIREAVRSNALETPPQAISTDTWILARAQ